MGEIDEAGRREWGERIRRERERRGWSQNDAVQALREVALREHDVELPEPGSLVRSWKRWESTGSIRPDNQRYLASLFESVTGALFPPARSAPPLPTGDVGELLQQIQASSVDTAAIQSVELTVDRICTEYPVRPAADLLVEARSWLARIVQMLQQTMTLSQRRELQVQAGWLAAITACLQHDTGASQDAEVTRRQALSLATEVGHTGMVGWCHEITAWQALTHNNLGGVITAAQSGAQAAGTAGVSVQLAAQEAKAYARMGQPRQAMDALDRGRRLLEPMDYPINRGHHFVVDPAKYDFYAMDVHRVLGTDDEAAEQLAQEVLDDSIDWTGQETSVMRAAEARVTLGVAAARRGDLEQAVDLGTRAITSDRQSLPSLLMVAGDLVRSINTRAPDSPVAQDFTDRVRALRNG